MKTNAEVGGRWDIEPDDLEDDLTDRFVGGELIFGAWETESGSFLRN